MKIDENKIFLTGFSLGGGGAWKYVTASVANANRIAGIIPVSPAPNYTDLCNIKKGRVAVWAHHAKWDNYITMLFTDYAIKTVNAFTPDIAARATYYGSGGHSFVAEYAYDTLNNFQYPNMYQWMNGITRTSTRENNKPPVAKAGNDSTIFLPASKALLNGADSYDPNDVIVQYTWALLSGPSSPALKIDKPGYPVATVEGLEPGTYVFRLNVIDEFGIGRYDDVIIHIALPPNGRNAVPLVDAGRDVETTSSSYHIWGNAKDFDGSIKNYIWRQVSGPVSLSILQRNNMADVIGMTASGTYGLELTAYDNHNPPGSGKDTLFITKNSLFPVLVFYWTTNLVNMNFDTYVYLIVFLTLIILPLSAYRYHSRL